MKLIVGLGNPGKKYENTRHNIGFFILDSYLKDEDVIFIKPTTFMNLSGVAVSYYKNFYKISLNDILIIHDDMDLEIGSIRLKKDSSSGGHNGIKNIIDNLNSKDFLRLKIGISKPEYDVIDYVLSKFSSQEIALINEKLSTIYNIIDDFIKNENVERLMNKYN